MDEEVALPMELVDRIDEVLEAMGFRTREELVIAAVRRLLDYYKSMAIMDAQS
jgi:metal-responsive CopG/Arc/MetJ family transcriptional regulator